MRWGAHATKDAWSETNASVLPVPFEKLSKIIRPKGGNCGILIAAPSCGKTTFLLNWVVKAGVKVLYISSDTSPHDLTSQLASLATGEKREVVEKRLRTSQTWRSEYAEAISSKYPNIVVDFTPSPSMHRIRMKAIALAEVWGVPPEMIVMDTASNVEMKDMGDNAEWQRVWLESISIARELNSFFMFAHHVKQGPARSGRVAPEMSDGLWGCDQFPEFVFGLHAPMANRVVFTVRKNRGGMRDVPVNFHADFSRSNLEEEKAA